MARSSAQPLSVILSAEASDCLRSIATHNHLPVQDLASVAVMAAMESPKAFMARFEVWLEEYSDKSCRDVYAAEDEFKEMGGRFKRMADVQRYVDGVCANQWWQRHSATRAVEAKVSRQSSTAYADKKQSRILLPLWGRKPIFVLHEMAHLVQPEGTQPHGPEYVRLYCDLVREVMGQAVFVKLRAALRSRRVRIGHSHRVYGLLPESA